MSKAKRAVGPQKSISSRAVAALVPLFALLATATACAYLAPRALAEEPSEELPQVDVTYEGSFEDSSQVDTPKSEGHAESELDWSAIGSSGELGEPGPLTFTRFSGGESTEIHENGETECFNKTFALAPGANPVPSDWDLQENEDFPTPGWRYEASDTALQLPKINESWEDCHGDKGEAELQTQVVHEFFNGRVGVCEFEPAEAEKKAEEALFAEITFLPGEDVSVTREFDPPECKYVDRETTSTVTVKTTLSAKASSLPVDDETKEPDEPGTGPDSEPEASPELINQHNCKVPQLKGKRLKVARKALEQANCQLGEVKGRKTKTAKVIGEHPKPGTVLAPGAGVDVKLSG